MVGCLLHIMKEPLVHDYNDCILSYFVWLDLQLNLSTMATLGTEGSGHCKEVAIAERFKQEWMYGLSATENGHFREVPCRFDCTCIWFWEIAQAPIPPPSLNLTLTSHLGQNDELGEG